MFDKEPSGWVAIGIACAALVVSGGSLLIAYFNARRDIRSRQPLLTASVFPMGSLPGWYRLELSLKSRDSYGYSVERIKVVRPFGGRLLRERDGYVGSGSNESLKDATSLLQLAMRSVSPWLRVRSSGTEPARIRTLQLAPGDSHSTAFLLWGGRAEVARSRRLVLAVTLVRNAEDERRWTTKVRRTLPALKSSASS